MNGKKEDVMLDTTKAKFGRILEANGSSRPALFVPVSPEGYVVITERTDNLRMPGELDAFSLDQESQTNGNVLIDDSRTIEIPRPMRDFADHIASGRIFLSKYADRFQRFVSPPAQVTTR